LLAESWTFCSYTETWLTSIADDVAPQHYAVLHVPRPVVDGDPERGGGVAVVFRQSVVVRRHPLTNKCRPKTFELQLVRVGTTPLTHTVANIYRPQWMSSVAQFVDELTDIIALNVLTTSSCVAI